VERIKEQQQQRKTRWGERLLKSVVFLAMEQESFGREKKRGSTDGTKHACSSTGRKIKFREHKSDTRVPLYIQQKDIILSRWYKMSVEFYDA
jgi:hypothetical protein